MIYIIDDSITYNSDDCTLTHLPTEESISLSISSGRLFERLLNSEGEILARDNLLTEVWDKYGLRGSNSNLNQYLSILRRALAAYGCENLIITIPKIGIRINTEIKIETQPSPAMPVAEPEPDIAAKALTVAPTESSPITPEFPQNVISKPSHFSRRELFFVFFSLLLLAACGYYWFVVSSERSLVSTTIKLPGGCDVVILKGVDDTERQSMDKQLLEIIKENNQPCDASRRFYFDNNTAFTTRNFGRTILSSCKINGRGDIISCDNFYYLDWRNI